MCTNCSQHQQPSCAVLSLLWRCGVSGVVSSVLQCTECTLGCNFYLCFACCVIWAQYRRSPGDMAGAACNASGLSWQRFGIFVGCPSCGRSLQYERDDTYHVSRRMPIASARGHVDFCIKPRQCQTGSDSQHLWFLKSVLTRSTGTF